MLCCQGCWSWAPPGHWDTGNQCESSQCWWGRRGAGGVQAESPTSAWREEAAVLWGCPSPSRCSELRRLLQTEVSVCWGAQGVRVRALSLHLISPQAEYHLVALEHEYPSGIFAASPCLTMKFSSRCLKIKLDDCLISLSTSTTIMTAVTVISDAQCHSLFSLRCLLKPVIWGLEPTNLSHCFILWSPFLELSFYLFPLGERKIQRLNFVPLQGGQIPTVEYLSTSLPHSPCYKRGIPEVQGKSCSRSLCSKENVVLRPSYMTFPAAQCWRCDLRNSSKDLCYNTQSYLRFNWSIIAGGFSDVPSILCMGTLNLHAGVGNGFQLTYAVSLCSPESQFPAYPHFPIWCTFSPYLVSRGWVCLPETWNVVSLSRKLVPCSIFCLAEIAFPYGFPKQAVSWTNE